MMNRIAGAVTAFLMTLIPATMIVHVSMLGQNLTADNLAAISPLAAMIGISLATMPAVIIWQRLAPDAVAAGSSRNRARSAPRAPLGADEKAALLKRTAIIFVVALFAALAAMNAWWSPGRGPLDFAPQPVVYLPALMIAMCAASSAYRLMRGRLSPPSAETGAHRATRNRASTGPTEPAPAGVGPRTALRAASDDPADAPDWGLLGPLFGLGCLSFALGILSDSGPAFLLAAALLGAAAAIAYDRQVGRLLRQVALPGLRHGLLLLVCCLTLLVLLTTIDIALKPLDDTRAVPAQVAADLIGRVLSALAALFVALPLLATIVRETPADGQERPLWPLFAALGGGGFCWYLLAGLWTAFTWPLQFPFIDWVQVGMTAKELPVAAFLIGASASIWYQAITNTDQPGVDWERLFTAAIRGALVLTSLALVLFLMVAFGAFGASSTFGPRVETNVELSVITCAVWLFALVRILPLQATSRLRALTVALAMNVLQAVMFGLAGYNWDPYIGDVLQLVFGLPILAAGWWIVAAKVPGWAGRFL